MSTASGVAGIGAGGGVGYAGKGSLPIAVSSASGDGNGTVSGGGSPLMDKLQAVKPRGFGQRTLALS
jgi:hypothetical protein